MLIMNCRKHIFYIYVILYSWTLEQILYVIFVFKVSDELLAESLKIESRNLLFIGAETKRMIHTGEAQWLTIWLGANQGC